MRRMRQRLINSASRHHVATQKKAHDQKISSKSQYLDGASPGVRAYVFDAPYPATRLISSSDAGFSKADVSPSFSPRYTARTIRRITFAFRVLGMSATKTTSRGARALPRSRPTFFFNSPARARSPSAPFFKTQKQTNA